MHIVMVSPSTARFLSRAEGQDERNSTSSKESHGDAARKRNVIQHNNNFVMRSGF
jgi:hypothetical protein